MTAAIIGKLLQWPVIVWFISMVILGVSVGVTVNYAPANRFEHAVAIGSCGGLPMLRLEDGSVWLRVNSVRVYRVEDPDKLTCG
jgi:hypothetical protein